MDEQLFLLAEAAPETGAAVVVGLDVLIRGANAAGIPRHSHPDVVGSATGATVDRMLELAEDALRYNQAPDPRLLIPEKRSRGLGSNGPIGRGAITADGKGIREFRTGESATWPQLLRVLATQRRDEPHVAQARDLAEAYHYLYYYSRAYRAPEDAPPKLLENLSAAIRDLGGDPTLAG